MLMLDNNYNSIPSNDENGKQIYKKKKKKKR